VPKSFKESLEAWVAQQLEPYCQQLRQLPLPAESKEFNDPVWGTILVRPVEVILLDSPLLQRLRMISQLGVVHYVYHAARHSRLEHTLGVVHQVTRLVTSFNEHYNGLGEAISEKERNLLRLTAMCHDVGHGALSHVSENALKTFDRVQDIVLQFEDDEQMEGVPLSEIASYYIVGSPVFRTLLDQVMTIVHDHVLPPCDETIKLMQRAIIGQSISDRVPLLHELISGPFDADKLDYMTRDAQMTGVPEVTDISRLVQKVRVIEVPRDELRQEIAETVEDTQASYLITGIEMSGGRTVDELILARTLQEDKLYRHHKVRAIEAMVASFYHQLAALAPDAVPMLAYRLRDSDFTGLDRERIAEVIRRDLTDADENSVRVAIDLADRLGRRDLFVRAYAFSLGMPLDPYRADVDHYVGLERLVRENGGDFKQRGRLIDLVVEELSWALELCAPELIKRYPDLKPYVWLDPLYSTSEVKENDSARAYLISHQSDEKSVIQFKDDYAESVNWAGAYVLTRDAGYVFAPADLAQYAYVAMEKVLRRDYGIRTPDTMRLYAKRPAKALEQLKRTLDHGDFYEGIAYDVRPLPVRLKRGDIRLRIDKVCELLSGYEGPVRGSAVAKKRSLLSAERVRAWLHQFPDEMGDQPLRLLEEMQLVCRRQVVAALRGFLDSDASEPFVGGALCPLGAPKDSSAVTTYWAGDEQGVPGGLEVLSLGEALTRRELPIVFVEDFIGSGQQSISILEAWLGVESTTKLGEQREPLSDAAAQQLRESRLAFVFASGQRSGADALRKRAAELDLQVEVSLAADSAPRAFSGTDKEDRTQLEKFCRQVGRELLLDPEKGHDEQWADDCALGYGNNAFLVLFSYNTPTQTLTCLWKDGVYEGVPWMALFPRRPKR
jgi:HD superfamily phosphohydrolase